MHECVFGVLALNFRKYHRCSLARHCGSRTVLAGIRSDTTKGGAAGKARVADCSIVRISL